MNPRQAEARVIELTKDMRAVEVVSETKAVGSLSSGVSKLPRVRLSIGGSLGVVYTYHGTLPNRWNRFWQWFLLGFEWEKLDDGR